MIKHGVLLFTFLSLSTLGFTICTEDSCSIQWHEMSEEELCALDDFQLDCTECDLLSQLERDLQLIQYINCCQDDRLPVTYNHFLSSGYLNMPSARMPTMGQMASGYSSVPPYEVISVAFQPFTHLSGTLNYRIYDNLPDPILGPMGFGDLSDRGLSLKLALIRGEDFNDQLPTVSVGVDDFLGTQGFRSQYIVVSQAFPHLNFEASLGYGWHRIRNLFGGVAWMPFRKSCNPFIEGISLTAEYDATDYRNPKVEYHPEGRNLSSRINYGVKYRWKDWLDLSASSVRGEEFAWSAYAHFNIADCCACIPSFEDPTVYRAPVNYQPIDELRPPTVVVQDFIYAFRQQGLSIHEIGYYTTCDCAEVLRLIINNDKWEYECELYQRIEALVLALTPDNIDEVEVVIETQGLPVQEYHFRNCFLKATRKKCICNYELAVLSPTTEVCHPPRCDYSQLFYQPRSWFCPRITPKTRMLFGSAEGKFKYALGISAGWEGLLFDNLVWRTRFGYIFTSSIPNNSVQDRLNPSQLPNVQTDLLTYYRTRDITVDELSLQKFSNLGCGWYGRASAGWFSPFYAGYAGEVLYYPYHSDWAFGVEGAKLRKRETTGLAFRDTVRKLENGRATQIDFDLWQIFFDTYYTWDKYGYDFKLSLGRFLAGDVGGRFEVSHTYPSGLRLMAWYTYTDGHDMINGRIYHDKGIGFSLPLDMFQTCSAKERWGQQISAWLRDVGVRTETGDRLYPLIRDTRR